MTEAREPLNVDEYERLAEQALDPGAYAYFAGGAGDERTLRDNLAAFGRWSLRPRMLVDVGAVRPETTVLGEPVSMPVLVAPTAILRLAHPDGEPGAARAAAATQTIYCLSTLATAFPAEVAEAAPGGRRWFQLYCYRDRGVTRSLVEQAAEAGFGAVVLTVDVPFLGRRERDLRTGFAVPAEIEVPSFAAASGRSPRAAEADCARRSGWRWRRSPSPDPFAGPLRRDPLRRISSVVSISSLLVRRTQREWKSRTTRRHSDESHGSGEGE